MANPAYMQSVVALANYRQTMDEQMAGAAHGHCPSHPVVHDLGLLMAGPGMTVLQHGCFPTNDY